MDVLDKGQSTWATSGQEMLTFIYLTTPHGLITFDLHLRTLGELDFLEKAVVRWPSINIHQLPV